MPEEQEKKKIQSIDPATIEMIEKAAADGVRTVFDRADKMKACPIGAEGSCCSICGMGPCRVPLPRGKEETPEQKKLRTGVCGATAETISARNFLRKIAAGSASHGDHGREVAKIFLATARGEAKDFEIKDEQKLLQLALDLGITIGDRTNQEIAIEMGELLLNEFGKQEGELLFLKRAPLKRQELWHKGGTSGHVQKVKEICADCDDDTVLFKVEQIGGAACHLGYESCFHKKVGRDGNVSVMDEKVFDPEKVYKK